MDKAEGIQHQDIAPIETPNSMQDALQEKVLKQSEVNELLGKAKHAAYEKGKREALENLSSQQSTLSAGVGSSMGGMPPITDDHIRKLIADEAQKQNQFAAVQQTLANFAQQMNAGKGKYSDFDETVANLGDLKNLPHVVDLATGTGIAADILYELGRNPSKVASLTTLAYINPDLAKIEMKKLADSIKVNEQAKESPSAREPLDHVKPSVMGMDNGSNSMKDLRRKPWARG